MREAVKASLSGKDVSCDVCGRVEAREVFVSIYNGPHGEKVDYCPSCFDREVVKK